MGQDLVAAYPEAQALFEQADKTLGYPLSQLCFAGPEHALTDTINAQPALVTHSIAVLRALQAIQPGVSPAFVAGHSLGEYSALVAADVLEFADALKLVRERGRVMKEVGEKSPGGIAAIIGMDTATLETVCRETGVQIANYNAPGQIVIAGEKDALARAIELAKARGARHVLPIAVSVAAHSRLMAPVAREFAASVAKTPMRAPQVPVLSNVTALPLVDVDAIRRELVVQLTSPVQWIRSIEHIIAQGTTSFVELGPKDVLARLIRRIHKDAHVVSIGDVASIKALGSEQW
ncbi:MAG: [acyl-carrier-protein] S-malonyltransferase [Candidatus Terrybacteria bacterium RIFCSPLOWO2_01_FULL_58_14]|uniref:Malonyl CoA-acyl carrier protein transacylase n=2 Tax=Candidatus Terryibacteriota TaxID=1817920 RepID=A0A1G2PW15_9BACT|nr:MAG: [acyl-carrier-protein] S-malonyltransferase [Candidatus Terrybacteria bacterium RIFCSPHIGHO2_01_FULL_58_15]OHA52518.1 MAG: [acyl-carrier-protein] S-malonyltransferase [Candidatus Terrybacteria bacterium RIFCSPLOWO2_01_FULL_58_14]